MHQPANHAGERTLHARDGHHAVGALDRLQIAQQAVQPADAHIVDALYFRAEELRGLGGFLGHGDVGGARRADGHAAAQHLAGLFYLYNARDGVVHRAGADGLDQLKLMGCRAGAQHLAVLRRQPGKNARQKFVGLAAAKHDLAKAGPQFAVGVQLGVAQFLIRRAAEKLLGVLDAHRAAAHLFQHLFCVHGVTLSG